MKTCQADDSCGPISTVPSVSIVLPTYNGARFLGEAIDSCRSQHLHEWELIIVDDASTDESPLVASAAAARDERIRVVRNPRNLGLPASLNAGFAGARGHFFTWISDDNRLRPHALDALVRVLEEHPETDIVYSDYSVIDAEGRVVEHRQAVDIHQLTTTNCVGASFLYRRAVHESLQGFAVDAVLVEDYDFWLRAVNRFRFATIRQDLYIYRLHDRSLSARHGDEIMRAHRGLLRRRLPDLTSFPAALRVRGCLYLARAAVRRGDLVSAASDLRLGLRISAREFAGELAALCWCAAARRARRRSES